MKYISAADRFNEKQQQKPWKSLITLEPNKNNEIQLFCHQWIACSFLSTEEWFSVTGTRVSYFNPKLPLFVDLIAKKEKVYARCNFGIML